MHQHHVGVASLYYWTCKVWGRIFLICISEPSSSDTLLLLLWHEDLMVETCQSMMYGVIHFFSTIVWTSEYVCGGILHCCIYICSMWESLQCAVPAWIQWHLMAGAMDEDGSEAVVTKRHATIKQIWWQQWWQGWDCVRPNNNQIRGGSIKSWQGWL